MDNYKNILPTLPNNFSYIEMETIPVIYVVQDEKMNKLQGFYNNSCDVYEYRDGILVNIIKKVYIGCVRDNIPIKKDDTFKINTNSNIEKLKIFCDNPRYKNFKQLPFELMIKLYVSSIEFVSDEIGNIFIIGKVIEYFSRIYLEQYSQMLNTGDVDVYRDVLSGLPQKIRDILNNQYIKTHKALNRHLRLDNRALEKFSECLDLTTRYDDENLCIINDRQSISENVNKWKALEIRAISIGYKPNLEYDELLNKTFVNYWEKT